MFSREVQRMILFGALGLVLIMIWQSWVEFQRQHFAANAPATEQPTQTAASAAPDAPAVPGAGDAASGEVASATQTPLTDIPQAPAVAGQPAPADSPQAAPAARLINVTTDLLRAQIDPNGGDLVHLELRAHAVSVDKPDEPFVLMHNDPGALFVAQSGLIGNDREYPNHGVTFEAAAFDYHLGDSAQLEVPLSWRAADGVAYQKVYRFQRDSYRIEVDFRVDNQSATAWDGFVYAQLKQTAIKPKKFADAPPERGILRWFGFLNLFPLYTFHGAAVYTAEDKYDKISYDDMRDANLKAVTADGWVAMLQHYFVAAWLPAAAGDGGDGDGDGGGGNYQFFSGVSEGETTPAQYRIGYNAAEPVHIAAGDSGVLHAALYAGPKEQTHLQRQNAEGLLLTVDYGWLTPISEPLFWLLEKIHGAVQNWGLAIILLTVLVKAVFYPLSAKSYKSMARMKKLGPRLQTLKERFGDDKQKFQQEMMKLYRTEKVNPAGGCLPILVQIPVFIALYWMLLESVELRQANFMLWWNDLSGPDPYLVLPLVMGLSSFAMFMLNPAPTMDPTQRKIMMAMPLVFSFIMIWFPSGLVLYWVVNNVLSIAQQAYIMHKYDDAKANAKTARAGGRDWRRWLAGRFKGGNGGGGAGGGGHGGDGGRGKGKRGGGDKGGAVKRG